MKLNLLLTLGLALLMTGCTEVTFDQPQPPKRWDRSHMPKSWQGTWVADDASPQEMDDNKIVISEEKIHLVSEDITLTIGEDTHLRWFRGYLVFSIRQQEKDGYFVRLAKRNKDTIALYEFDGTDEEKIAIWEAALPNEVAQTRNDDGEVKSIRLTPVNNAAFGELIKTGGLTRTTTLVRWPT